MPYCQIANNFPDFSKRFLKDFLSQWKFSLQYGSFLYIQRECAKLLVMLTHMSRWIERMHRAAHLAIPQYIIFSFFHCKRSVPGAYWLNDPRNLIIHFNQCPSYFNFVTKCLVHALPFELWFHIYLLPKVKWRPPNLVEQNQY